MYFDRRLWQLTRGLRGWIASAILLGLVASVVGIARFAILGVLLSRVFDSAGFVAIAIPAVGVAIAVLLRGFVDHHRAMISHRTANRVQEDLRGRLYDKIAALGPAWFAGERTGGVMLSIVDGVEQLQTFFGQYVPQVCIAVLTPLAIFLFIAFWDVPVAAVMLVSALVTLVAPTAFAQRERSSSQGRQGALKSFGSEFLDGVQGLPTLKAFGQSHAYGRRLAARARGAVRQFAARLVDGRDDPRHHRLRGGDRRCVGLGPRGLEGLSRPDEHRGVADRADGRHRGLPAAARFTHGPASGDARAIGRCRHQCAARRRTAGPRAAARPACDQPAAPPDYLFRGCLVRLSRRARRRA